MDNTELSNQEQAQLAALVAETEAARLRAIRRISAQVEKNRVKETVFLTYWPFKNFGIE